MESFFFHPRVVHVPIGLAVVMPLIAGVVLLAWWRRWVPRKSWLLVVALQAILFGSGLIASQAGEAEEDRVEQVVAHDLIEEHEAASEWFVRWSGGALLLMAIALALGDRKAALPFAAVATFATLFVLATAIRTGQLGGELVYEHGAAGAYTKPGATPLDSVK